MELLGPPPFMATGGYHRERRLVSGGHQPPRLGTTVSVRYRLDRLAALDIPGCLFRRRWRREAARPRGTLPQSRRHAADDACEVGGTRLTRWRIGILDSKPGS